MWIGHTLWMAASLAGVISTASTISQDPIVDLEYATYQGYYNATYDLNIWKGIRYAAPPVGKRRWQAPVAPPKNNTQVTPAVDQPPICPQSGAARTPYVYGFNSGPGDEDCLFLNVYAPRNASDLPVLVWIHGGGYGLFGAYYDPSALINTNDNKFITVEIQYRLGAFGFLSSDEVKQHGQTNAGLLDQRFALEWVQQHIPQFGGDPTRVTIGGESSGAGSVMFHALSYGGQESYLFNNIIAASPYTPPVFKYNDSEPQHHYARFAELAGCGANSTRRRQYLNTFHCLVASPSALLQNASGAVSTSGLFGTFAFLPVVDGILIRDRPSQQLLHGHVSGKRILVGNNANDGVPLTNPNVVTRSAFNDYISHTFPHFTQGDIARLNAVYQTQNSQPDDQGPRFDTLGDSGPTALNVSEMATGLQQTVFNIFAETTFDCPAEWLAQAFSGESGLQAWKYQYSVTPAYHGADLNAVFSEGVAWPSAAFIYAFQKIWGNFIINDSPVISIGDATGNMSNATVPLGLNGQINWPEYTPDGPWQMDLNTTGGTITPDIITSSLSYYLREGDGITNRFRLVNATSWEGGRGERCSFWRDVSARVPQ